MNVTLITNESGDNDTIDDDVLVVLVLVVAVDRPTDFTPTLVLRPPRPFRWADSVPGASEPPPLFVRGSNFEPLASNRLPWLRRWAY